MTGPNQMKARAVLTAALLCAVSFYGSSAIAGDVALIAGGGGPQATAETFDSKTGTFVPTANDLTDARDELTATTLKNKMVLIAGGSGMSGELDTAELYNRKSRKFSPTGNLNDARGGHTATLLNNGRVLLAGGFGNSGALDSAEVYDLKTGTFTPTSSPMSTPRTEHTATLLGDGRVLIAGGEDASFHALKTAEVFDPRTGTFTAVNDMNSKRRAHSAVKLNNGMVLITGGQDGTSILETAELFNPKTNSFAFTNGDMTGPRWFHASASLNGGQALILGGQALILGGENGPSLPSAELYDPKSQMFTATGSMSEARSDFDVAVVPGGILVGGSDTSADLYRTKTGMFSPTTGTMNHTRHCGAAASLRTPMSGIAPACD